MKRALGKACIAALLLISCCVESQADLAIPMQTQTERDRRRAKLEQMAVLVNALSQGKSKLMIKTGVSADPGGRPGRPSAEYGNAFLTVYPVTIPINTRLPMAPTGAPFVQKYGRILGALEVIVPAGGPEDKEKAEPGVYLLFMPINGAMSPQMPLWLISVDVADDGSVTYATGANTTVQIARVEGRVDTRSPSVSASIDFTAAATSITWSSLTYTFGFRMEILYR